MFGLQKKKKGELTVLLTTLSVTVLNREEKLNMGKLLVSAFSRFGPSLWICWSFILASSSWSLTLSLSHKRLLYEL